MLFGNDEFDSTELQTLNVGFKEKKVAKSLCLLIIVWMHSII